MAFAERDIDPVPHPQSIDVVGELAAVPVTAFAPPEQLQTPSGHARAVLMMAPKI